MTAAGLPTVHVKLDDGTGTFPYDITAYARLKDGYAITRGRSDELESVQPGTLSLTLDNTDGRFTLASGTYGIHVDQKIRVTVTVGATTSNRFTGFVQAWPVDWPDGSDLFSTVQVNAVDASARWNRRVLGSLIDETTTATPLVHYPLDEPSGSTVASDAMQGAPLRLVTKTAGAEVSFGEPSLLAASAETAVTGAVGQYLQTRLTTPFTLAPSKPLTVEAFFYATSTSLGSDLIKLSTGVDEYSTGAAVGGPVIQMGLSPSQNYAFFRDSGGNRTSGSSLATLNDGHLHHLAYVYIDTGANTYSMRVYIDGVAAGSLLTGLPYSGTFTVNTITVANGAVTMCHAAVYQSSSATDIATRAQAGLTGFVERSDLRIARLIGYEGTLSSVSGDTGLVTIPAADIAGTTVADSVEQVVDAEVGLLWINGSGTPQFANKDHVALATTAAMTVTVGSDMVDPGTGFSVDMQQVTNYVTSKREGDDLTLVASDSASITAHGRYAADFTYLVQTDNEAQSRGQWLVTKYAEPSPRLPTLGLDLMTADSANQILALALDLDAHMKVTGWPSQSPLGSSTDLVVEGYTETLSDSGWDLSLNCASWTQQAAFILNDSSWGVLDTNLLGI